MELLKFRGQCYISALFPPPGAFFVERVANKDGVAATIFVRSGDQYMRVATTVNKEDGTSAFGTPRAANSPAIAKLNNGERFLAKLTTLETNQLRTHPVR